MSSSTWFWLALLLVVPTALLWAGGNYENYDEYLASLYRDTVPVIEPEEAGVRIASEPDTVVLDVRSDPERSVSFIAGSEFFNFEDFDLEPGSASDGGEGNGTGSDTDPDPPVHGREPKWGRWVNDGNVTYDPPAR